MQFSDACISFLAHHRLSQRLKRLFPLKITASYLSFYCFLKILLRSNEVRVHQTQTSLLLVFVKLLSDCTRTGFGSALSGALCVKNFRESYVFHCLVIKVPVLWQLVKITISFHICQQLFSSFYFKNPNGEGGSGPSHTTGVFHKRHAPSCAYAVLAVISDCYPQYEAGYPRVTHPSATKIKTTSTEVSVKSISVRLACVKHAASVHPEPGSNSLIKCVCNSAMPASASLLITGWAKGSRGCFHSR